MPTKTGKPYSNFYGNDLAVNQSSNTGIDSVSRNVQDGFGNNTSLQVSTNQLIVVPQTTAGTATLRIMNAGGDTIFAVDTTNSKVTIGASQVPPLLNKEMGLYDFPPGTAGYHYPLVANTMFTNIAIAYDNDWGNGTDPPEELDVSGLTKQENAIAVYWFLENNITLNSVRYMATADGRATLNFHLFAYTLDTSSNHGDLSAGIVHATATVDATATTVKTGTFTLDKANIDSGKVVIGFVENVSCTTDVSVAFNIQYFIR